MAGLLSKMLRRQIERGAVEEFLFGFLMRGQQGFDLAAQIAVLTAGFVEESRALGRGTLQRLTQQLIYSRPTIRSHKSISGKLPRCFLHPYQQCSKGNVRPVKERDYRNPFQARKEPIFRDWTLSGRRSYRFCFCR